jgi:hypothetical protein
MPATVRMYDPDGGRLDVLQEEVQAALKSGALYRPPSGAPQSSTRVISPREVSPNFNREWSVDAPRAAINAIPPVMSQVVAGTLGRFGPTGRMAGGYTGGFTGEMLRQPLATLLGESTPAPFTMDALRSFNQAGNDGMLATGVGDATFSGVRSVGRRQASAAINPTRGMKELSDRAIRRRVALADRIVGENFPGGLIESAEAAGKATAASGAKTRGILSAAEAETGRGVPASWSTVAGPNAQEARLSAVRRLLNRGPQPASPPSNNVLQVNESGGLFRGPLPVRQNSRDVAQFSAEELRPAVDRVLSMAGRGRHGSKVVARIEREWEALLRNHPDGFTPQELKNFKDAMWLDAKTTLAGESRGSRMSSDLSRELGSEANRMLRRIGGFEESEVRTKNLLGATRALESAAMRPERPLPWVAGPASPIIRWFENPDMNYRVGKFLANSPGMASSARNVPTAAWYGMRLAGQGEAAPIKMYAPDGAELAVPVGDVEEAKSAGATFRPIRTVESRR